MLEDALIRYMLYPDSWLKHPDIGHINMVENLFPYMEPKKLDWKEYIKYYQITYEILCKDFDSYLEYLDDKFWKDFFKNKRNQINSI